MATVFVSHSSRDDVFAKQLSDDLDLIGHTPWIDDIDVRPGQSIISSIQDGISKSRYALVVLSPSALQSGWIESEWKEKLWETITSHKVRVIPVLREACD